MNGETIKERITEYLQYKGLTQAEFAEGAGLSTGFVNALKESITMGSVIKICKAYGDINLLWLVFGEGYQMLHEDEIEEKVKLRKEVNELKEEVTNADKEKSELKTEILVLKGQISMLQGILDKVLGSNTEK